MRARKEIMTNKNRFILLIFSVLMLMTSVLQSCAEREVMNELEPIPDTAPQFPISFGGELVGEESAVTRADQTLGQHFYLYGYKTLAADNHPVVFPKYTVYFMPGTAGSTEDNTHNYYYVDPDKKQYIKYWDYSASEYRYWGYVDNPNISSDDGDGELTITGIAMGINEPKAKDAEDRDIEYLVSTLKLVPKAEFGNTVQMRFVHPYAKVRVMIYSGEKLASTDVVELSDISFGPEDTSKKIVSKGTLQIEYPFSGDAEIYTISSTETIDKFVGDNITLTNANCASNSAAKAIPAEDGAQYYYILSLATGVTPTDFKFSVVYNGTTKTAIVPAAYMHWKPNYSYTYIFKISDGTLLFVDAKIVEWQSGGSANDTWTNW